jgi:hypothetical protein
MTASLTAAVVWVFAGTACALLPMRHQMIPGLALLIAAPLLIGWIGWEHGWIGGGLAACAFVSMFRNPLRYLANRALGRPAPLPPELARKHGDPPP